MLLGMFAHANTTASLPETGTASCGDAISVTLLATDANFVCPVHLPRTPMVKRKAGTAH
jgi:hypothetical protein